MQRRLHILIFVFFVAMFGYFFNGGGGNQVARLNQTRAIVNRGTLYVERIGFPTDDQLRIDGHAYSSKAPGTSLLGVPPYALFKGSAYVLGLDTPFWKNFVVHLTTIVTVGVPCALAMLALYVFLCMVGIAEQRAFLATTAIGLGTTFFPYATMYFGHSLCGSLAFLSFYLLRRAYELRQKKEDPGRRVLYAALLISGAVLVEYPAGIIAILLTLYLISTRPSRREFLGWVLGGAIGLILLGVYNQLAFGSPLALSYLNYQHASRNTFPQHSRGLGGVTWPQWHVLKQILWGESRGLIWFSPVLVLVVPGLCYLAYRRRDLWREGLLIVLMVAAYLSFNAGYGDSIRYWGGANSAGPRHLIPIFPFVGIVIGLLVGAAPWVCALLIVPSIAICLATTAVLPQVPMLYRSPIEQLVIPFFLDGRLAIHRGGIVSRELVTENSIAYNWGKLMGLPGSWGMLPLFVVAALFFYVILWHFRANGSMSRRALRLAMGGVVLVMALLLFGPLYYQAAHSIPLEGPGVQAIYYPGKKCEGRPVKVTRENDLRFRFQGEDIRPDHSKFCADWQAVLEVPEDGRYFFYIGGAQSTLRIDGAEIASIEKKKERRAQGSAILTRGPHSIEVNAVLTILNSRYNVRWRRPNQRRAESIPAELLHTPGYQTTQAPGEPTQAPVEPTQAPGEP